MKANELRIGNLILHHNHKIKESFDECIVWMISEDHLRVRVNDLHNEVVSADYCSGIPLTEEWLLKFGFEKTINPPSAPIWDEDIQYSYEGYRFCQDVNSGWFLLGYSWNTKHFKYVHQLQNLYFALTEEELTLTTANPNI